MVIRRNEPPQGVIGAHVVPTCQQCRHLIIQNFSQMTPDRMSMLPILRIARKAMSALPLKADKAQTCWHVRLVPIVLQKSPSRLCEIEICNNRIGASVLLNRCCSFVADLESMFRDQMPKILLQHNLPKAD